MTDTIWAMISIGAGSLGLFCGALAAALRAGQKWGEVITKTEQIAEKQEEINGIVPEIKIVKRALSDLQTHASKVEKQGIDHYETIRAGCRETQATCSKRMDSIVTQMTQLYRKEGK